jgi:hypothetical protein
VRGVALACQGDGDFAGLWAVLDRIRQQVGDHLLDPVRISMNYERRIGHRQAQPVRDERYLLLLDQGACQRCQVEVCRLLL